MKTTYLTLVSLLFAASATAQVMHFPFDGNTRETVSSTTCNLQGVRTLPYAEGISGQALRLDGYSNFINEPLSLSAINESETITFSIWVAPETYPMTKDDAAELTPTYSVIAGNLDDTAKSGFAFMVNTQGGYKFRCFQKTYVSEIVASDILPLGKWSLLTATFDKAAKLITLYRNGQQVGTQKCAYGFNAGTATMMVGKSRDDMKMGNVHLNTFNGLIDELKIVASVQSASDVLSEYNAHGNAKVQPVAVNSLLSEGNILRPQFHAMPAKCWTNETHGMVYHNGQYHVFFQKNGNGPYMRRLHWGHVTSTDLINWKEQPIAIAPGQNQNGLEANDGKGCWSGAIFQDADFNGGKPTILYTGVSNAKAHIWMAAPKDDNLLEWEKQGVIISSNGNPATPDMSDDFRDPYFFTAHGSKFIIVGGSSKTGVGTCALYKYNGSQWQYQGLFFTGSSRATCGRFWEMPTVTPLSNGKYLFTATPLDMGTGVKCIYWIGTIGADGRFTPDQQQPQDFEMAGTSRDGYGLLSPTICASPANDGSFITLGIVPDKVSGTYNYQWGWAHNYSLPRIMTLSDDGKSLVQRPYDGLMAMRSAEVTSGRQIEMVGEFQYSSAIEQGFRFLKNGDNFGAIVISNGNITVDISKMQRIVQDGVYGGKYTAKLNVAEGDRVKVDAYLDGSILDVFVNNVSAFSVRLFPTDANATGAEAFSSISIPSAHIYSLDNTCPSGIDEIQLDDAAGWRQIKSGIYSIDGQQLATVPAHGVYIADGKKYVK